METRQQRYFKYSQVFRWDSVQVRPCCTAVYTRNCTAIFFGQNTISGVYEVSYTLLMVVRCRGFTT